MNDNAPLFRKKTDRVAYIENKFKKGFEIYKVQAFDLDPSEKFSQTTYHLKSIFSANNSTRAFTKEDSLLNSFSLDPKTGDLTYNSNFKLNSLFTNEYIIEIEAADADKPAELRDEFNLTLIVLPSNDKIPVFERTYRSSEEHSVTILKISARNLCRYLNFKCMSIIKLNIFYFNYSSLAETARNEAKTHY